MFNRVNVIRNDYPCLNCEVKEYKQLKGVNIAFSELYFELNTSNQHLNTFVYFSAFRMKKTYGKKMCGMW